MMTVRSQVAYSPGSPATSIADLPAELLLLIFKFLYMHIRADEEKNGSRYELFCPESVDILSPGLFPHTPASVSKVWMNVLSSFPPFWTRVIIFTDSPLSFSLPQLEWSRELLIDVIVITRKSPFILSLDAEQKRLRQIIDVVTPHVRRCQTLRYEVTYTSSLPRIATDFRHPAPHLRKLILHVSVANGLPGFLDGSEVGPFPFPKMRDLKIDGWNFVDLFKNARWWFDSLLKASLHPEVSISHYRPTNMQDRFLLHDAFPLLDKFFNLSLENVLFDFTSSSAVAENEAVRGSLDLCGLGGQLTAEILDRRSAWQILTITRCPLTGVASFPMCEVVLRDIDDPHISADLRAILPTWEGYQLNIHNCPWFDDSVLDILGEMHVSTMGHKTLNAPALYLLSIKNCHRFTISALRRMTEAREAVIADGSSHYPDFDLEEFTVKVQHVAPLEEADKLWFKRVTSLSDDSEELWQRTWILPWD